MKHYPGVVIAAAVVLAGCAANHGIIDIETDKVVILENGDVRSSPEEIDRLAREGCALHGRTATPISVVQEYDPNTFYGFRYRHLYACLDPDGGD